MSIQTGRLSVSSKTRTRHAGLQRILAPSWFLQNLSEKFNLFLLYNFMSGLQILNTYVAKYDTLFT